MEKELQYTNETGQLESLFTNLFDNKVIYHERVTLLCDVDMYRITEGDFRVWLKPVKPLYLGYQNRRERMYKYLVEKKIFSLGSALRADYGKLFDGKRIGRPYCPYTLWASKELVERVSKMNDQELDEHLYDMLWD